MSELKPCPFCGGTQLKVEGKSRRKLSYEGLGYLTVAVRCNKCHSRGGTASGYTRYALYSLTEKGEKLLETEYQIRCRATEAWNRRADNER